MLTFSFRYRYVSWNNSVNNMLYFRTIRMHNLRIMRIYLIGMSCICSKTYRYVRRIRPDITGEQYLLTGKINR